MHGLIIKCAFLLYAFGHTASQIPAWYWISTDATFGQVINVFCKGGDSDYRWIFANKTLAENNELVEADSTRYSVSVGYTSTYDFGSLLLIRNALRDDGGWYECQKEYYSDGKLILTSNKIFVPVKHYYPSLAYPKCSICPSITLHDKSNVTFNCKADESTSSLNLLLTLQYQNGSIVQLGHNAVTKSVTLNDNNAVFVCHMTSDLFPSAYRSCSTDPVTVQQTSFPRLETSTKTTETITAFVSNPIPSEGHNADETDSIDTHVTYGIIGGSIGVALIVIAAITCIIIALRKSNSEESNQNQTNLPPSSAQEPDPEPYAVPNQTNVSPSSNQQSVDHPYTAYQRQPDPEPYATLNQTNGSPSSDQKSADHLYTAYQKQPDPEPYATLNQTNVSPSPDQEATDHPYTAYQKQPEQEPYAALNQTSTSVMSSDPDYQNMHDYEDTILTYNELYESAF